MSTEELQNQLTAANEELATLRGANAALTNEKSTLQTNLADANNVNTQLQANLTNATNESTNLQTTLSQVTTQNNQLQSQVQTLTAAKAAVEAEKSALQQSLNASDAEKLNLQTQLQNAASSKDLDDCRNYLARLETEHIAVTAERDQYRKDYKSLELKYQQVNTANTERMVLTQNSDAEVRNYDEEPSNLTTVDPKLSDDDSHEEHLKRVLQAFQNNGSSGRNFDLPAEVAKRDARRFNESDNDDGSSAIAAPKKGLSPIVFNDPNKPKTYIGNMDLEALRRTFPKIFSDLDVSFRTFLDLLHQLENLEPRSPQAPGLINTLCEYIRSENFTVCLMAVGLQSSAKSTLLNWLSLTLVGYSDPARATKRPVMTTFFFRDDIRRMGGQPVFFIADSGTEAAEQVHSYLAHGDRSQALNSKQIQERVKEIMDSITGDDGLDENLLHIHVLHGNEMVKHDFAILDFVGVIANYKQHPEFARKVDTLLHDLNVRFPGKQATRVFCEKMDREQAAATSFHLLSDQMKPDVIVNSYFDCNETHARGNGAPCWQHEVNSDAPKPESILRLEEAVKMAHQSGGTKTFFVSMDGLSDLAKTVKAHGALPDNKDLAQEIFDTPIEMTEQCRKRYRGHCGPAVEKALRGDATDAKYCWHYLHGTIDDGAAASCEPVLRLCRLVKRRVEFLLPRSRSMHPCSTHSLLAQASNDTCRALNDIVTYHKDTLPTQLDYRPGVFVAEDQLNPDNNVGNLMVFDDVVEVCEQLPGALPVTVEDPYDHTHREMRSDIALRHVLQNWGIRIEAKNKSTSEDMLQVFRQCVSHCDGATMHAATPRRGFEMLIEHIFQVFNSLNIGVENANSLSAFYDKTRQTEGLNRQEAVLTMIHKISRTTWVALAHFARTVCRRELHVFLYVVVAHMRGIDVRSALFSQRNSLLAVVSQTFLAAEESVTELWEALMKIGQDPPSMSEELLAESYESVRVKVHSAQSPVDRESLHESKDVAALEYQKKIREQHTRVQTTHLSMETTEPQNNSLNDDLVKQAVLDHTRRAQEARRVMRSWAYRHLFNLDKPLLERAIRHFLCHRMIPVLHRTPFAYPHSDHDKTAVSTHTTADLECPYDVVERQQETRFSYVDLEKEAAMLHAALYNRAPRTQQQQYCEMQI